MVCEMEATHVQNQNELWDIVSANCKLVIFIEGDINANQLLNLQNK